MYCFHVDTHGSQVSGKGMYSSPLHLGYGQCHGHIQIQRGLGENLCSLHCGHKGLLGYTSQFCSEVEFGQISRYNNCGFDVSYRAGVFN